MLALLLRVGSCLSADECRLFDSGGPARPLTIVGPVEFDAMRGVASGGARVDDGHWLFPDRLLACSYPWGADGLARLAERGIAVVVNLHEQPHDPARLERAGLTEVHLPVPDFTAPTQEQLARGVQA